MSKQNGKVTFSVDGPSITEIIPESGSITIPERIPGKFMKWLPLGILLLGVTELALSAAISAGAYVIPEDAVMVFGVPVFFLYPIALGCWYLARAYKKGRSMVVFGMAAAAYAIFTTAMGM